MPLNLPRQAFSKEDRSPDSRFYAQPRFVTHIDDRAIAAVTEAYRELLPAGGVVLDLMSSWVSHLPPEVEYAQVIGHGMNRDELAANPRLSRFFVQDLNADPVLPLEDGRLDGAVICVSIQYLQDPVPVLREVARALRSGAPLAVTFSNRCFPTKAVLAWRATDDAAHVRLVRSYFQATPLFGPTSSQHFEPEEGDPLFSVWAYRR